MQEPDGPCERQAQWGEMSVGDAGLDPICARISWLVDSGMKGEHVVAHFIDHCIAPLQEQSHPMWEYQGINDHVRLFTGRRSTVSPQVLEKLLLELVGGPAELEPLAAGVVPLYQDPKRESIIAGLPACVEWGIWGRTPPRARWQGTTRS